MTFRDISPHFCLLLTLASSNIACWAPEVEPPAPKASPAELAGAIITNTANAEIPSPPQQSNKPKAKSPQTTQYPQGDNDKSDRKPTFPYTAKLSGDNIPLLGHGGGIIMTLDQHTLQEATIDVLEEKDGRLRVVCKGCSDKHPFQAGWISSDYVQRLN